MKNKQKIFFIGQDKQKIFFIDKVNSTKKIIKEHKFFG